MDTDVLIFGGGIAGLWALDRLTRLGYDAVLLEANALGAGQTIAAQGIIHGGMKYALQGSLTSSAANIRDMPNLWRDCLLGGCEPDLQTAVIRAEQCYLWRTDSVTSRLGMLGARIGLRVAPSQLDSSKRPAVLAKCPGTVAEMNEQVIDPGSVLDAFRKRHESRLFQIDAESTTFQLDGDGAIESIRVQNEIDGVAEFKPRTTIMCAGGGNEKLLQAVGCEAPPMQRRPLHMVLLRGDLPILNGHCVDGAKTRVTITSTSDSSGRVVWQVGGQIAEDGVQMNESELFTRAAVDLLEVLPGWDFRDVEIACHRVDRAERLMTGFKRPDTFQSVEDKNWIAAWPTKLALAPMMAEHLAEMVKRRIGGPSEKANDVSEVLACWTRPKVAKPPWECVANWARFSDYVSSQPQKRVA